ncbi:MAG: T9SS type A sorting domain-containing protein [Bacteroidia bacterium]
MHKKLLFIIISFFSIQQSFSQSLQNNFWETDGVVNSMVKLNNKLYLAGEFSYVGPNTGSFAGFNATSQQNFDKSVNIKGIVHAIAKDASGKVYMGGEFTEQGRTNLLVLNPDGTLNSLNISVNGPVKALKVTANILLVGGSFSEVGSAERLNCAAINISNGQVLPLAPNPNGEVNAFEIAGAEIILGGSFTSVASQERFGIASISALSGSLQSLNTKVEGTVKSLLLDNATLFIGGLFTKLDTSDRNNLGAVNMFDNTVTFFNPNVNGVVNSMAKDETLLYVGGSFSSISSETRNNLAGLNKLTGLVSTFNPSPNNEVLSLSYSSGILYSGGLFTSISGQPKKYLAAINSNSSLGSSPLISGNVNVVSSSGDTVFVGGSFSSFGGTARSNLAAVDFQTGIPTSFGPIVNNNIHVIKEYSGLLLIGGEFTSIGNISRSGFAVIDTLTGVPITLSSNVNGYVNDIEIIGNDAFIAGSFSSVSSENRNNLASISLSTGSVNSWNPGSNDEVYSLLLNDQYLYVNGSFTNIASTNRGRVARFDIANGITLNSWNPSANGNVYDVLVSGEKVYLAGTFSGLNEDFASPVSAVDTAIGAKISAFNPSVTDGMNSLLLNGTILYAAGNSESGVLPINIENSEILDLGIKGNFSSINKIDIIEGSLFIAGEFKLTEVSNRRNFAVFNMVEASPDISASSLSFSDISPISMKLSFTKGNGRKRIVLAHESIAVDSLPSDGKYYAANSMFGMGESIGFGNYVIYNGTENSIELTGLNIGTTYHFTVIEYNGFGSFSTYKSSNPLIGSQSTIVGYEAPTVSASSVQVREIQTNSMKISWTKGNGSKRIVVAKEASAVNAIPTDSTALFASDNFGNGYDLGDDNYVIYNESGDSLKLFNLKSGTTYHFAVFEYNGIDAFARVKTDNPALASFTTLTPAAEPTEISSAITFSEIGTTSVKVSWTSGNGAGRIMIASESQDLLSSPDDGESYFTDGNFSGNSYGFSNTEKVVYIGAGNSSTVTGLNPGSTYYFGIVEFNGSGFTINYLQSSVAKGNVKMKIPGTPPVNPSRALSFPRVSSDSLYLKWISGIGQGRVVFARKGGLPSAKPVSGVTYNANSTFGLGDSLSDGSFAIYDGNSNEAFIANLEPNTVYGVEVFDYNIGDFGNTYQLDSFAYGLKSTAPLTGLRKFMNEDHVKIYPIPAQTQLTIDFTKAIKGKLEIKILDLSGKSVYESSVNTNSLSNQTLQIDLSNLENGNFILYISNGKEFVTKSLVVSK